MITELSADSMLISE